MSAPVQPVVHTPGPWSLLCDEARGRQRCLVVDAKGNEIASVNPYRESWNQDAELMAAAPDLLEALHQCLLWVSGDEFTHGRNFGAGNAARDAIEKATGVRPAGVV